MHFAFNSYTVKYLLIGLIILVSPLYCFGHNPLSAKYQVVAGENASLLTINLSQNGVNQALINKYGKQQLTALSKKEFEELMVAYIKDNFSLSIDDENIELKTGGIKPGSHQTDLKFVLPPISKNAQRLNISIPAFAENKNHQTIFYYQLYGKQNHVILSDLNDYQSSIELSPSAHISNWVWMAPIGAVGLALIFLVRRKRARE